MHILIHEPNPSGHRLTTVRVLLDALLKLKAQCHAIERITIATTVDAIKTDEYREQLSAVSTSFELYVLPVPRASRRAITKTLQQVSGLRHCLQALDADHVYLPYTDFQLQLLTLSRLLPWSRWWPAEPVVEAQLMKSSFAYPFGKRSRKFMSLMSVRYSGCERVHLNDSLAISYLHTNHPDTLDQVRNIPDPISHTTLQDKQLARAILGIAADARVVGCLGVINERKGADILVRAFVQAKLADTDVLLLAGRLSPALRQLVDEADDKRIHVADRYLTEEELCSALSAMDLVATPYRQVVGSASIIIRAAMANRMVLSSDTGWAGVVVPHYGLGRAASIEHLPHFKQALEHAMQEAPHFQLDERATAFIQYNAIDNVHAHWTALLSERVGLVSMAKPLAHIEDLSI